MSDLCCVLFGVVCGWIAQLGIKYVQRAKLKNRLLMERARADYFESISRQRCPGCRRRDPQHRRFAFLAKRLNETIN